MERNFELLRSDLATMQENPLITDDDDFKHQESTILAEITTLSSQINTE